MRPIEIEVRLTLYQLLLQTHLASLAATAPRGDAFLTDMRLDTLDRMAKRMPSPDAMPSAADREEWELVSLVATKRLFVDAEKERRAIVAASAIPPGV